MLILIDMKNQLAAGQTNNVSWAISFYYLLQSSNFYQGFHTLKTLLKYLYNFNMYSHVWKNTHPYMKKEMEIDSTIKIKFNKK